MIKALPALALIAFPAHVLAQEMPSTQRANHFRLFSACRPMDLVVESLNDDAKEMGLTKDRLRMAAESRLRSAQLYSEGQIEYLYVNVNVVGLAFSISLVYKKGAFDEHGNVGMAATWNAGKTGTHGRNPGFIISGLSELMDKFLVEYLRVNEAACEKSKAD